MKTDFELQKDVMDELNWEPMLDSAHIGVSAREGVVSLSGHVSSYSEKRIAEKAAEKVEGVKAIVQEIDVILPGSSKRTDEDIATAAVNALKWDTSVAEEKVKILVNEGTITLDGEVDSWFQKKSAEDAVENLIGVREVINLITIKPQIQSSDVKTRIKGAFERSASIDADKIIVETHENKVILKGTVRSFAEKRDAERAAWAAPGVLEVENDILINAEILV